MDADPTHHDDAVMNGAHRVSKTTSGEFVQQAVMELEARGWELEARAGS
jgi:hypothetical protein